MLARSAPLLLAPWLMGAPLGAATLYEVTSAYHHIRVVDAAGIRTLYFDDAPQTQMAVANPLQGHFEYTELFHAAWLWNPRITNVLMIGLGGGSAQRSFEHYYPHVRIQTAEIDPTVVSFARRFFEFRESDRQRVTVADGRMHLRRSQAVYDLVVLDAYVRSRYGSSIPQHLATREFFELVRDRLTTNGVLACNLIGTTAGFQANLVGAVYRTLQSVFPQVYLFRARTSQNLVLIATRSPARTDMAELRRRATVLVQSRQVTLPSFRQHLESVVLAAPASVARSPVLTDDYAPVEGLASQP